MGDLFEDLFSELTAPVMSETEQGVLDSIFGLIQQQEQAWEAGMTEYMGELGDFGYKEVVTPGEWHEATNEPEYSEYERDVMAAAEHARNYLAMGNMPDKTYMGILNAVLIKHGMATTSANRNNLLYQAQHLAFREPRTERWQDPDKVEYVERTEEEWRAQASEEEILDYETRLAAKERERKALAGELPLTEAGQKRKAKERELTIEALRRKGVSENSTAWIQTMSEFDERWARIEEAERYGQIQQGTQDILGLSQLVAQDISNIGAAYTGIQGGTQGLMHSYAGYMQPYTSYNMAGYQAQAANQAQSAGLLSSLFGAAGSIGGTALGYGLFG